MRYVLTALLGTGNYGWSAFRGDVMGGFIASLLVVPAAVSFGVLAGLGPLAGLYGALTVGVFGSLVEGTRGTVSGPDTDVSIVMAFVVAEYTTGLSEALIIAIMAGIIQVALGLMRFGRYVAYVPASLLGGFFAGVGILIVALQLLPAIGAEPVTGRAIGTAKALPSAVATLNWNAVLITAICLAAVISWRGSLRRAVPPQFIMLVFGTLVGFFWFPEAPVIGSIDPVLPVPRIHDLTFQFLFRAIEPAFMIALLSSIGVLAGAMLVDSLTGRAQQPNRLVVGHGFGNVAAGLVGGLPGGAGNGTLANIRAGGRTPISNLTVSLVVAIILFSGLSAVIELIPKAVLAAILISTGWSIIDWRLLSRVHCLPRGFTTVMLLTAFVVVVVDIVAGLVIGFIVSTFVNSRDSEEYELRGLVSVPVADAAIFGDQTRLFDPFAARTSLIRFPNRVSVASTSRIVHSVGRDMEGHAIVIFDLSNTEYIDDTAAVMLDRLIDTAVAQGTRDFVIVRLSNDVARKMRLLDILDRIPEEHIVADWDEAKTVVRPILGGIWNVAMRWTRE